MATTKQKPTPPPAPKLPTRQDVEQAGATRKAQEAQHALDHAGEESDEQTSFDAIRSDLQDAHESMVAAWTKLDALEAESS